MGAPAKKVKKAVKKATKFVDKKLVEPLERPVKKTIKKVEKAVVEPVEKAYKKTVEEVKDTVAGTDKTDRRPPAQSQTAQARTGAPREEAEEVEAVVETEGVKRRQRRKGKKQLVAKPAAAIAVGGEGSSGLNIPKG